MFYIQDGNVKLTVTSRRGKIAALAILRQGDFFGERCLVSRSLRTFTATAIQQSTVARVKRRTMVRIIQQEPGFAKLVIAYLLSRILRIEEDLVDQIFHPSEKRLARILLLLALAKLLMIRGSQRIMKMCRRGINHLRLFSRELARFGRKCESKSEVLKVSQQTLAEMVGTTRLRISLFMNWFRQLGFIHYKGGLQVRRGLFTFALQE